VPPPVRWEVAIPDRVEKWLEETRAEVLANQERVQIPHLRSRHDEIPLRLSKDEEKKTDEE